MKATALLATLMLGLLAALPAAEAYVPRTLHQIAFLTLAPGLQADHSDGFVQGIRELGYVEDKNIIINYWGSAGNVDRLRENAAELVRLGVHVIVTGGPLATRAPPQMTHTIPIVMAGDFQSVGDGFVASLGQPGSNITGVTTLTRELSGKRLELLKDTVPRMARVAVLSGSHGSQCGTAVTGHGGRGPCVGSPGASPGGARAR